MSRLRASRASFSRRRFSFGSASSAARFFKEAIRARREPPSLSLDRTGACTGAGAGAGAVGGAGGSTVGWAAGVTGRELAGVPLRLTGAEDITRRPSCAFSRRPAVTLGFSSDCPARAVRTVRGGGGGGGSGGGGGGGGGLGTAVAGLTGQLCVWLTGSKCSSKNASRSSRDWAVMPGTTHRQRAPRRRPGVSRS